MRHFLKFTFIAENLNDQGTNKTQKSRQQGRDNSYVFIQKLIDIHEVPLRETMIRSDFIHETFRKATRLAYPYQRIDLSLRYVHPAFLGG